MVDKYRIVMAGHGKCTVYRNGEKVDGVLAVKVEAAVESANIITLTVYASDVEVEVEAENQDG